MAEKETKLTKAEADKLIRKWVLKYLNKAIKAAQINRSLISGWIEYKESDNAYLGADVEYIRGWIEASNGIIRDLDKLRRDWGIIPKDPEWPWAEEDPEEHYHTTIVSAVDDKWKI